MKRLIFDGYGDIRVSVILASIFVGIAAFVAVLMFSITWIDAGYSARQCDRFSVASGRETKFRRFSFWSYDCYVRAGDGKWILKDQLRDVAS